MAKPPRPVYDDPFVVSSRYLVYHNGIDERPRPGLDIRSATAPLYLRTVFGGQTVNGIERRLAIATTTYAKCCILFAIVHQYIICHNAVSQFRMGRAKYIVV